MFACLGRCARIERARLAGLGVRIDGRERQSICPIDERMIVFGRGKVKTTRAGFGGALRRARAGRA
ncbi:hypothetical protein PT2222_270121 [Paraburkholderia tropica]